MSVPHRGSESKSELLFVLKLMQLRLFSSASGIGDAPGSVTASYFILRVEEWE